jgi:hypothetical protein
MLTSCLLIARSTGELVLLGCWAADAHRTRSAASRRDAKLPTGLWLVPKDPHPIKPLFHPASLLTRLSR